MGCGRQVRHGRVHRRGSAIDQGTAGQQATFHVSSARCRPHG